jgi:hypothetical protein
VSKYDDSLAEMRAFLTGESLPAMGEDSLYDSAPALKALICCRRN